MKTREEIVKARSEWLANAKQQLIETDAEIALFEKSDGAWEAVHKLAFPGSGYAATMRAQSLRLQRDIARHEEADRNSR
jgi:hypothetical protein